MAKQAIKDKNFRTIGYIEDMSDGKQKATNANHRTLGYFDPKANVTQDVNYRTISRGNVLSALIFKQT